MDAILGIDASWTEKNPSGVALAKRSGNSWKCVALESSYDKFINKFNKRLDNIPSRNSDKIESVIKICKMLLKNNYPEIITVDMPISTKKITGPRAADKAISSKYGSRKCGAFSPNKNRPGRISEIFTKKIQNTGHSYEIKCNYKKERGWNTGGIYEVYPHVALLKIMNKNERIMYKANKTHRYWRGESLERRKKNLGKVWRKIIKNLTGEICLDKNNIAIPGKIEDYSFNFLKEIEDKIDALVCLWMGIQIYKGDARPIGDETAAIWVPKDK